MLFQEDYEFIDSSALTLSWGMPWEASDGLDQRLGAKIESRILHTQNQRKSGPATIFWLQIGLHPDLNRRYIHHKPITALFQMNLSIQWGPSCVIQMFKVDVSSLARQTEELIFSMQHVHTVPMFDGGHSVSTVVDFFHAGSHFFPR